MNLRFLFAACVLLAAPGSAAAEEIDLVVYTLLKDGRHDPDMAQEKWFDDHCTSRDAYQAKSKAEFLAVLKVQKRCGRTVRSLRFTAHGNEDHSGVFDFSDLDFTEIPSVRPGFKPGATVTLLTCNAGDLLQGALWVREFGKALLSEKGGAIEAPVGRVLTAAGAYFSWGDIRYEVSAGGGGYFHPDIKLSERVGQMRGRTREWIAKLQTYKGDVEKAGKAPVAEALLKALAELEPRWTKAEAFLEEGARVERDFERLREYLWARELDPVIAAREAEESRKRADEAQARIKRIMEDNALHFGDHRNPVTGVVDRRQ